VWTDSIIAAGAIGAIVWIDGEAEAAGFANLETREPMTPQHRTRVGSIDKTYMAVVAVTIFDDLDVTAARWVPELDERITLRHLLSHRSGLFDYMWDGETYERLAFDPPALSDSQAFLQADAVRTRRWRFRQPSLGGAVCPAARSGSIAYRSWQRSAPRGGSLGWGVRSTEAMSRLCSRSSAPMAFPRS
jgi:CubicO group peptidase (beta-lactamase class C family)